MPSPFTFSLVSLNQEQFVIGITNINKISIFLIIEFYNVSIFAAQYLYSGIFPKGSSAGFVSRLAAPTL